jgi:hypothetical protein
LDNSSGGAVVILGVFHVSDTWHEIFGSELLATLHVTKDAKRKRAQEKRDAKKREAEANVASATAERTAMAEEDASISANTEATTSTAQSTTQRRAKIS